MITALEFSEYQLRGIRESLALKQKIVPFDVQLTDGTDVTVDESNDLVNINDFKPASINIIENPGLAVGDTGWDWSETESGEIGLRHVLPSGESDAEGLAGGSLVDTPASISTSAYPNSAVLTSLNGTYEGLYSSDPPVPTQDGVFTYYNTTSNTWHFVVFPFQSSWQSGDADILSGRFWRTETTEATVVAGFDINTYDSSITYAYYDSGIDIVIDIDSWTAATTAAAASFVVGTFDTTLSTGVFLGTLPSDPTLTFGVFERYYNTTTNRWRFHAVNVNTWGNAVNQNLIAGYNNWIEETDDNAVVIYLETNGFDSNETYAYYDGSELRSITSFTAATVAAPASITTSVYDQNAAFGDLSGAYQGATVNAAIPSSDGLHTYYDRTDLEWYYVIVPFQSSWQSAALDRNFISDREWLTDTIETEVEEALESSGFDTNLNYAYYDAADTTIYDIDSFTDATFLTGVTIGAVSRISGTDIDEKGTWYTIPNLPAGHYTFSFYMRDATGSTPDEYRVKIFFGDDFEVDAVAEYEIESGWTRYNFSYIFREDITNARWNWFLERNDAASSDSGVYIDAIQVEPNFGRYAYGFGQAGSFNSSKLTDYIPTDEDRFMRWLGDENQSMSIREPNIREIHKVVINSVSHDIYLDFDRDSSNESIFLPANGTIDEDVIVKQRVSFVNAESGELARVRGYVIGI